MGATMGATMGAAMDAMGAAHVGVRKQGKLTSCVMGKAMR